MDVDLTPERADRLAEAGYVLDPVRSPPPVRGRLRVRDGAGHPFDLALVDVPDGAREAFIAHLSSWFAITDSDLEPLVDALDLDDVIGYLTAPAAPETLETFVEATGRLGAGHTSTVLVTLGRTLARLHAQGVAYGPMRPRDVLVVSGRVLLTVPRPDVAGPAAIPPSPQEDAYHLAALADSVIERLHGPQAPPDPPPGLRGLVRLVVSALGDAKTRPGVGTLATLSHDLAPCLPLVAPQKPASPASPDGIDRGEEHVGMDRGAERAGPERIGAQRADSHRPDVAGSREGGAQRGLDRPGPRRRKAFRGATVRERTRDVGTGGGHLVSSDGEGEPATRRPARAAASPTTINRAPAARSAPATAARPGRRRHRGLAVVTIVAVVAAVSLGAVVVNRLGAGSPAYAAGTQESPATGPAASSVGASAVEDPGAAAARLTRARMDRVVALTNAVPAVSTDGDWADVMLAGSPAHTQAAELVSRLQAQQAQISGLTVETGTPVVLAQAAPTPDAPGTAQVQITFTISAYTLRSAAGAQEIPASVERAAVLDLVTTDSGWVVAGVSEVEPVT